MRPFDSTGGHSAQVTIRVERWAAKAKESQGPRGPPRTGQHGPRTGGCRDPIKVTVNPPGQFPWWWVLRNRVDVSHRELIFQAHPGELVRNHVTCDDADRSLASVPVSPNPRRAFDCESARCGGIYVISAACPPRSRMRAAAPHDLVSAWPACAATLSLTGCPTAAIRSHWNTT